MRSLSRHHSAVLVVSWLALLACNGEPARPPPPPLPCQALTSDGGGVDVGSLVLGDPAAPHPANPYQLGKSAVTASSYMVVSAHPLASRAGCEILLAGGSAMDAAIAVQMVLGLVEPQASGLGGGAFLVYYDAKTKAVGAYDGRETAPAGATGDYLRFVDATNQTLPLPSARASGRSIGTPGALRLLELGYQDHGRLPWSTLFDPAIQLARNGFPISGRLAFAIATTPDLLADADATATYFAGGQPAPLGAILHVPAYADTLTAIAAGGADALYTGDIGQAIVAKIGASQSATGAPITPGLTTLADLAGYQAKRRDPICTTYRSFWICGAPPPTSGGIAVAEALGVLEHFDLAASPPIDPAHEGGEPDVTAVHAIAEAERLAYADRDAYVADPDFVPLPGGSPDALLAKPYLAARAMLINPSASLGTAPPGDFGAPTATAATPEHGTSQITIVDADGNALAMTTTVESTFGSFHMARGVILNNQLTDFSAEPTDATGAPIANRVAAGKRPRSSMAPTLVFRMAADGSRGDFLLATGSPGGATIIQYVVKDLVGMLDWGLDPQQAAALIDFGAANDPTTNVGGENPNVELANGGAGDPLVSGLRTRGHTVSIAPQSSGIATIVRAPAGALVGGADPRREGLPLGDLAP